tara:strand:- start:50 stop:310 length:261 start_codon:yes stop_codon:yes gene_type:complete
MSKTKINKKEILTAFEPKKICSICESPYDEDAGGIQGHFGIMPVTFCEWCYSSIYDMIYQDVKEEVIDQYKEWQLNNPEPCGMSRK